LTAANVTAFNKGIFLRSSRYNGQILSKTKMAGYVENKKSDIT